MTQHTPGTWEAQWSTRTNGGPKQGWHVFNRETVDVDGIVCDLADGNEAEANARLIAEAPAMLDALRWVSDFLAVKLDQGQACILEDEVNAILSRIDGDVAPEI